MNVVALIGNLATEVDFRELDGDQKLAAFLLAVDRPGPDSKADFVRVTVWGKQADVCSRFLAKGRRVAVDGKLRSRSWQDHDGKRRSSVEVNADSVEFLSRSDDTADAPFEPAVA